jgi:hypothetical protein
MIPFIYDISNDISNLLDSDSSKARNVTALSTGGTKLLILGFGFSENSALGNQVLIDNIIECEIVTYYTTPSQIQCIVPPYNKTGIALDIMVIIDNTQTAVFYNDSLVKIVYICKNINGFIKEFNVFFSYIFR